MSVTYDPRSKVLGMPVAQYREILSSWATNRRIHKVCRLNAAKIPSRSRKAHVAMDVAVVVDDAEERGLFGLQTDNGGEYYGSSESGKALLSASAAAPIPAAKARRILDEVLGRAKAANGDATLPFRVDRVWLFGSLAKGAGHVNDIDFVVESSWKPGVLESRKACDRLVAKAIKMGGESRVTRDNDQVYNAFHYLQKRVLYGERTNPRLAPNSLHDLIGLHQPCMMVFDATRGGPVDDALLGHHPDSTERGSHYGEPRRMPDLAVSPVLMPTSMNVVAEASTSMTGFDDGDSGIPGRARHVDSPVPWKVLPGTPLATWLSERGGADGRATSMLVASHERDPHVRDLDRVAALLVERFVSAEDGGLIGLAIKERASLGRGGFTPEETEGLAEILAASIACDRRKASLRSGLPLGFPDIVVEDHIDTPWSHGLTARVADLARLMDPALSSVSVTKVPADGVPEPAGFRP